jgi:hypothetical protein
MTSKEVNIWSNWAKKNPGISHGWDKVGIGYDSCEIAKGIIMKTRKSSMLRLSGVVMPETQDAATVLFEKFILRVKQERGMGPCEGDQLETVNEMLTRNTQHSVCYVTSLNPDCKMCFIGAVYNTPTLNMGLISDHLDELKMGLSEMGLSVVFEVSDSAGCNAGYANRVSNIAAKEFIPADILAMHGLDGECLVAFRQQADGTVTFQLDDPPHVLKRVVGAARNRPLSWEWNATMNRPMSVDALRDVYYASLTGRGELTLASHRKMTPDLFAKTDRAQTMKVAPAAKLLSNTMVTIIDKVCNDPSIPLETVSYGSRKQLYSKARELCMNMNGFFDVCNSKKLNQVDRNRRYKVMPDNAVETANEFLRVAKWYVDWKFILSDPVTGEFHKEHFVPDETYASMLNCCYGFAAMIYDLVVRQGISIYLFRVNQDVCEHHFSNIRVGCGHCRNPSELHANACAWTSHWKRLMKCSKYGNVTVP